MVNEEERREYLQTQENIEFVRLQREKQKEKAAARKEARKVKLERIEEATTKRLERIGKRIKKIDITKTPKAYKELQKAIGRKKVPSAEIKRRRAHELKIAKLRHKQRMQYLQAQAAQADLAARETDGRYTEDRTEDQFLSEPFEAPPIEDYGSEYPREQGPSKFRRFLRGANNLRVKSSRYFEYHRERPKNMLAYENKFNRPLGPKGNDKIMLMNSNQTNKPIPLQFTTAPRMGLLKGVKIDNSNKKWNIPKNVKTW